MHARINWVIFDIDDVLVDIDTTLAGPRRRVFDAIYLYHGKDSQTALQIYDQLYNESFEQPGSSLLERFKLGQIAETVFLDTIVQATGRTLSMGEIRQCEIKMIKGENTASTRLLALLAQSCNVACFANTHTLHWEYMLRHFAFFRYLKVAMASHLSGVAKPTKAAFSAMTKRLNASPQSCLLIDDHEASLQRAQQLGWQTLHFHSADQLTRELRGLGVLDGQNWREDTVYWNMTNA